ncbi:putative FK506-binding protein 6 [Blattamonas nauphoetae]|uniref:peptidylprolyl isomerase n=1 Tax=Blattamonas nauphoetae TaxID=2049346 RepID=A0ABQ9YG85_9EUKA|nr:putative FK506-binding protein 6 [Blattamonas nauphoetae]
MSDTDSLNSSFSSDDTEYSHDSDDDIIFEAPEPLLLEDGSYDLYPSDKGKIVKKVIKAGSGDKPTARSLVQVHYTGKFPDGEQFDSSQGRQPFEFKLGKGSVIKGWEIAVASMQVGEEAEVTIDPEFGYGETGSPPTIPASATLIFNIQLLSFRKEPETAEEKLAFAQTRKEEGNTKVKNHDYKGALDEYDRGVGMIEHLWCDTDEMKAKHADILAPLQLNKALCCIKLGEGKRAVRAATDAISLKGETDKALYRRGVGYRIQGEMSKAKRDVTKAWELNKSDRMIREELEKILEWEKKKTEREKKIATKFFQSSSDSDPTGPTAQTQNETEQTDESKPEPATPEVLVTEQQSSSSE